VSKAGTLGAAKLISEIVMEKLHQKESMATAQFAKPSRTPSPNASPADSFHNTEPKLLLAEQA
jgi:hypothetical protein